MKKRALSVLLILAMVVGILPTSAYAEGTDSNTIPQVADGKAMIGTTQYESLPHAIVAAGKMDEENVTIYLGAGEYTLKNLSAPGTGYVFALNSYWTEVPAAASQNLIFIGQSSGETKWKIGNGASDQDQSFAGHQATLTFKNMTLETTDHDYDGFSHCKNITVEDCTVKNRIYNWCHDNAVFRNTTFDVGNSGYALFAYSATNYDFENCTFNLPQNGRAIRGFRDFDNCTVTINFKGNTINSPYGSSGGVIELDTAGYFGNPRNINYIVNFLGTNTITDNKVTPNPITCSEWFSITGWRADRKENALWQTQNPYINGTFQTDEAASNHLANLNITATIKFNDTIVWQDGRWAGDHDGTYDGKWKTWGYADNPSHKEKIYSSTRTPDTVKETVKNNNDWSHKPEWSTDPNTAYATDPVTGQEYRYWVEWCKYCHHIYDSGTEYKSVTPSTCTVTFKVVNGTWDDGTTADQTATVTLTAGKGTLNSSEVPAVGTKPNANYQAGSWDVAPNTTADGITGDVTYTYTYAPTTGSATVTFKVVNGTWSDGATGNKTVTIILIAGKGTLPESDVPTGMKANFGYVGGSWNITPNTTANGITGNITYTYSFKAMQSPPLPPVIPSTGSVTLTKVDSEDKNTTLANVVFDLYKADGTLEGTYTTGTNGKITVRDLPAGKHYWIEIRPAEGYMLDSSKHTFTVSGGKTTQISIANTRTAVPDVFSGDHYAYVIGYDDGLVHPEENITRAEVATIFFRLLDDATRDRYMTKINTFSDVQQGMWFNTAVSTMAAMGIVNGYPDGNFYPNAKITRAEFAAITARFDSIGNTTGVSFSDIYGHWAQKEINVAYNNGWILGYEDGTFKPNQNIIRAEAMTLINRVLQRVPENKNDLLEYMVEWPDNMDITKWYYLSVQEATNSHDYGRKKNGYEYWTELREVRDWAALEK